MTKHELIAALAEYPDDAVIFDGNGTKLEPHHISRQCYDDYAHATKTEDGEIPAEACGISLGTRR